MELRSIDGYRIERKTVEKPSDVVDSEVEFELIAEIPDSHLVELAKLKEQARSEGKITRKVSVDPKLSSFSFLDKTVTPGQRYVYQVVPTNNGGVKGARGKLLQVLFRGETSEIRTFDTDVIGDSFGE